MTLQIIENSPFFQCAIEWDVRSIGIKSGKPKAEVFNVESRVIQALSLCVALLSSPGAYAQFDSIFVRPSGKSPAQETFDTSRFKVRAPESRKDEELEETPGTVIASPVPAKKSAVPPTAAAPATSGTAAASVSSVPAAASGVTPTPSNGAVEEPPPVAEQVKELILGGSEEDIDEAKKQIHPEDPRANILGITLAPAYFYNGSSSNYSFRDYHSEGPGMGLGMNLWFSPFFGIQSKYFTSVSGGVRDGDSSAPMTTSEFEAGLRFRKHFGFTRKSAQIAWGIDYHDLSNKIGNESTGLIGSKTSGLSFSIEGVVPTSNVVARTFEVAIRPWQHHSEMDTGVSAQSGTKNESNQVSLSVGTQYTLDRSNQIFWKAQYSVERNLFNGGASVADPRTSTVPSGVSVTNSLFIFYFGLKWGS